MEEEIFSTSKELGQKLNTHINHFAFAFGHIDAFDRVSTKIAKSKYKYIYSGIRGNNFNHTDSNVVYNRDNIEPTFGFALIDFFLKGFMDIRYASDNKKVSDWVRK